MKLRLLHCIYDDPRNPWVAGGGAVRLFELYRRMRAEVEVTVVTGNFPGAREEVMEGVRYRRVGGSRPYAWSRLSYARAASALLLKASYDVAVFDYSVYTPLRWPVDRPVGLTIHHLTGPTAVARWGPLLGGAIAAAEARAVRRARCISVTSAATRAQLEQMVEPGTRLVSVGAGVADELFDIARAEEDFLLYFGRLDWFQKGLDTLFAAAELLVRRHPELELRVAGRGKDLERARERVSELGIGRNVRFLGAVTETERAALLSAAKVLLMPSRFEGFGMVAAEAMAAGVPLVAAAAGSLPEVVDAPRGGLLVPVGDAAALAAAVEGLLEDDERRRSLSHSARQSAERFRWNSVIEQHLIFLEEIRRTGAAPPRTQ